MEGRRNPVVASEGIPFLLALLLITGVIFKFWSPVYAVFPVPPLIVMFMIFRDPKREVPATPLGVVCPADGVIAEVGVTDKGVLEGESHRIVIRVDAFGTYTARCPIEGKIMDLRSVPPERSGADDTNGLWVQSDEGDDVVLQFRGYRFGLAPLALLRYGDRVGQGQRCAYLRLARLAEVQLPMAGRVLVETGQRVMAGTTVLAKLPHP